MFDLNNMSVSSHLLVSKGVNLEYGNLPSIFLGHAQQKDWRSLEKSLSHSEHTFLLQKKERVLPLAECLKPSKYFLMRCKQLQVFDCYVSVYICNVQELQLSQLLQSVAEMQDLLQQLKIYLVECPASDSGQQRIAK